jgi:hypothetical protein
MVRGRGPLSAPGLRRLAQGMAEALSAIHAAGVVHRDLKPGNVMLADDRPIVIDFGIAQTGDATRLTQTGLVMGTPGYLAPEVIEGQPSTSASDVHSWGATMAFAATGRPPFGGGSYETIFYRIVSGRADLEGVPGPLVPLISAALAREPAHRPSAAWLSAQASALDLSRPAATYTAVQAGPTTQAPRAAPYQERRTPKQAARDVADLLPPVAYVPAKPNGPNGPGRLNGRDRLNGHNGLNGLNGRNPASPGAGDAQSAPGRPDPEVRRGHPNSAAGFALMVAAVALTVALPVAGLIASLAVITLLRAADRAQNTLAARRSLHGPKASDLFFVLVMSPLTVVRALLAEALMAPLALGAGAAAYAATIVGVHSASTPRAGAYAAAAVVAWYGLGPGSARPRGQLNRMAGAIARTRISAAVTVFAAWAVAFAAVTFAASQTPYYWPMMTPHLPGLHSLLSSAANWLLKNTHAPF